MRTMIPAMEYKKIIIFDNPLALPRTFPHRSRCGQELGNPAEVL